MTVGMTSDDNKKNQEMDETGAAVTEIDKGILGHPMRRVIVSACG